jgi:hypothetical protein
VKLSNRATARKYRTWCISMGTPSLRTAHGVPGAPPLARAIAYRYRTIPQTLFQLHAYRL